MTLLQNTALQKTLSALKGSSRKKANAIAAVEDVEKFVRAASNRFLRHTLCDPVRAWVGQVNEGLAVEWELSIGGSYWRGRVTVVDLGSCHLFTSVAWEEAIRAEATGRQVVYTDGNMDQVGRVGGGWYADGNGAGSVAVGNVATVWHGKVAGMRQALQLALNTDVLVLSDSKAALLGIGRAASCGQGKTRDLVEVVDEVGRRDGLGYGVQFGWVKAHVGIYGNKRADLMAKAGWRESLLP